jgi:hypothetical protein
VTDNCVIEKSSVIKTLNDCRWNCCSWFFCLVTLSQLWSSRVLLVKVAVAAHKRPRWTDPVSTCDGSFETPYITLHTGTGLQKQQTVNQGRLFHTVFTPCFPSPFSAVSPFCSQSFGPTRIHFILPFSIFLLWNHLPSPLLSVLLYYFWPLGRCYSHGDTDKAIRTLNGGSTLLIECRNVSIANSRALPHVRLRLHFENWRKIFKFF